MALEDLIRDSLLDDRVFQLGQIWTVSDELISIPDADRANDRVLHTARIVLVVSNHSGNSDPLTPVVTVVPLSHRVDCMRLGDVELYRDRDRLKYDSIARIRLIQPVLKVDLSRNLTTISDDGIEEILIGLEEFFGLSVDE